MISAGQQAPQQYAQQPYGQQGMQNPYGMMGPTFTTTIPQWQAAPQQMGGWPTITVDHSFKNDEQAADYLKTAAGLQFGGNIINGLLNIWSQSMQSSLASEGMQHQADIAMKYYSTQGEIAGYQREVALKQLQVQSDAINVQQSMHSGQMLHEEVMAKLENSAQARLASIAEQGKTDRARIMSMTDAFKRSSYDSGSPFLPC